MAGGLLALLDDVAALVKASAASLDDISAQVAKTSGKVSGIVIDDAAVTPKYVVGLDPARELHIIWNIAKKSAVNKLLFLTPIVLLLGWLAPWVMTPILMVGGSYLCFEGYEKVHGYLHMNRHESHEDAVAAAIPIDPLALETLRTNSAIRTDFILSAEIMTITYFTVISSPFITKLLVMVAIAVLITAGVYGVVGLIVKMDDIGLWLSRKEPLPIRALGQGIVKSMPPFLAILGAIGTAAMLWVGADIIIHGIPPLHHLLEPFYHWTENYGIFGWLLKALSSAVFGIGVGFIVEKAVHGLVSLRHKKQTPTG